MRIFYIVRLQCYYCTFDGNMSFHVFWFCDYTNNTNMTTPKTILYHNVFLRYV